MPIENMWSKVKSYIAKHNITYKMKDIMQKLLPISFAEVETEYLEKICSHSWKLCMKQN